MEGDRLTDSELSELMNSRDQWSSWIRDSVLDIQRMIIEGGLEFTEARVILEDTNQKPFTQGEVNIINQLLGKIRYQIPLTIPHTPKGNPREN